MFYFMHLKVITLRKNSESLLNLSLKGLGTPVVVQVFGTAIVLLLRDPASYIRTHGLSPTFSTYFKRNGFIFEL